MRLTKEKRAELWNTLPPLCNKKRHLTGLCQDDIDEYARRIERAVLLRVAARADTAPCSGTVCCAEAIAAECRTAAQEAPDDK